MVVGVAIAARGGVYGPLLPAASMTASTIAQASIAHANMVRTRIACHFPSAKPQRHRLARTLRDTRWSGGRKGLKPEAPPAGNNAIPARRTPAPPAAAKPRNADP